MGRNTLKNYVDPLINGQSMAASFNGTPFEIEYFDNISIMLSWAGANPIGTIAIQVCNNYSSVNPSAAVWAPLKNFSGTAYTSTPGGTPGAEHINAPLVGASFMRVVYTTAGGSVGSLTVQYAAKGWA